MNFKWIAIGLVFYFLGLYNAFELGCEAADTHSFQNSLERMAVSLEKIERKLK